LRIKLHQFENSVRHVGADRQTKRLRGRGPYRIFVRPCTCRELLRQLSGLFSGQATVQELTCCSFDYLVGAGE
jgi:hypothetical protein